MATKTIDSNRKTYFRKNVLHICAGKMLLRAPEDTQCKKGDEIHLASAELDADGVAVSGIVRLMDGTEELWTPWPEGKEKGEGRTSDGKRKLYKRQGLMHFCQKGKLYAAPKGTVATMESRVEIAEFDDEAATVVIEGAEEPELWERSLQLESTRKSKKDREQAAPAQA